MANESMTTLQSATQQGQNLKAAGFMFVAVLGISLIPLFIDVSGGTQSPFLFSAIWTLGVAIGCLIFLAAFHWDVISNREVLSLIWRSMRDWKVLLAIVGSCEFVVFVWSARFIDITITTLIFYLFWSATVTFRISYLYAEDGRYGGRYEITSGIITLFIVSLFGCAFVIAGLVDTSTQSYLEIAVGVGAAAMAAILAVVFVPPGFRWGSELSDREDMQMIAQQKGKSLEIFFIVIAFLIGSSGASILNMGIGLSIGEKIDSQMLLFGIAGVMASTVAGIAWRKAIFTTDKLGTIAAVTYGTTPFALTWLTLFSVVWVANADHMVVGVLALYAANILVVANLFEYARMLGFKVMIISLWACGTWVYLRDASWEWAAQSDGYFDVLFLSATVFALILSFRTVRLASRIQEEDNRAFKLFRELEELERRGVISPGAKEHILTIDQEQGLDLESSYVVARRAIGDALGHTDDFGHAGGPDREKLTALLVELDALAHSRQQGINFGEKSALFIFAFLVVGTALFSRPAGVSGFTGFLVEMFAMMFPAVILFMAFNVVDLEQERVSRILKRKARYGGYGVAFPDTTNQVASVEHTGRPTLEQRFSVVVGVFLIVAYACLFLYKWGLLEQWGLLEYLVAWYSGSLS